MVLEPVICPACQCTNVVTKMQDLVKLEEQGWQALSSKGDAAKKFYGSLLTDDAIMVFPDGMLIEGREKILESMGAQRKEILPNGRAACNFTGAERGSHRI